MRTSIRWTSLLAAVLGFLGILGAGLGMQMEHVVSMGLAGVIAAILSFHDR